jgi:hypothetical protein
MNFRRTKTKALPIRGEPAWRQSAGAKKQGARRLPVRNNRVTNSLEVQPQSELSEAPLIMIATRRQRS